jgi:alpha-L-arabinofuranosidase
MNLSNTTSVGITRRQALGHLAVAGAAALGAGRVATAQEAEAKTLRVSNKPQFDLSPWLYMQFMEPLGTTDGSVEASWDHLMKRWRPDLLAAAKELSPPMMRWGGLFSGYYRWREGVGPRDQRKPMHNLAWGGTESNQVGTAEFLDYCKELAAEPLMCVNFGGEGDPLWVKNLLGEERAGDAAEAAAWVSYCNNPQDKLRISHGRPDPMPIHVWQLGNETSYGPQRWKRSQAIEKTIEFSRAMRKVDPSIKLIAWGDSGWAPTMIERAGEHINYVAFHDLFDPGKPLNDLEFRHDPAATWAALMNSVKRHEKKLLTVRQQVEPHKFPLALTECHFTMQGRNRCDLNSAWAVGVAYARFMNLHERHGDLLKIANIGDFCGTRWQTNVIMIPTPGGKSYVMPVGKVAALYRKHAGKHFVNVTGGPAGLDVTASKSDDKYFLHVVNTDRDRALRSRVNVEGLNWRSGRTYHIAVSPEAEIVSAAQDPMRVVEKGIDFGNEIEFPPASVTAVELDA